MRVTNASTYRNFTTSVNNVHLTLNRSMNKISSGERYESAAEAPLAYYEGKRIDTQYQDVLSKKSLLKDVQNRIYQQEVGVEAIQKSLSLGKDQVLRANSDTTSLTALDTLKSDLLQKQHEIVDSLNAQYENFYIYGGNDISNPPFSLSADGTVLTFSHTFPGDSDPTEFEMTLQEDTANPGTYKYTLTSGNQNKLLKAMREQGRIDIGYGSIHNKNSLDVRDTLLDTYTGGMNVLTGLTSDAVLAGAGDPGKDPNGKDVMAYLNDSPLGLLGSAVQSIGKYIEKANGGDVDRSELHDSLEGLITRMGTTEHRLSSIYADLGNKYNLIDTMEERLTIREDSMKKQYKDKLGADPYESIMEMYNNNYAYNAALQVGSKLMSSSLFDFMG